MLLYCLVYVLTLTKMLQDQRFPELNHKLIYIIFGQFVPIILLGPNRLLLVLDCLHRLHCAKEKLFDTDTTSLVNQPRKFGVEVSDTCFVSFSQRVFFFKFILCGSLINTFSHNSPLVPRCPV